MQLHFNANRDVRVFHIVLGMMICQGLAMAAFYLWFNIPSQLLEMLP